LEFLGCIASKERSGDKTGNTGTPMHKRVEDAASGHSSVTGSVEDDILCSRLLFGLW